ncbi:Hypothetical_protein [Hexamita inflata]|uniref:Hypothetical_protein n=1 Tax=Hexamita inflata TaxID=28002 RepID=A0ABP1HBW0_9EUKA
MNCKLANSSVSLQMFLEMASTLLKEPDVLEIPQLISVLPNGSRKFFWVQMSYYLNAAVPDLKRFFEENIMYRRKETVSEPSGRELSSISCISIVQEFEDGLDCLMDFYNQ